MTWTNNVRAKAAIVHDQIMAAKQLQERTGIDASPLIDGYFKMLEELYADNYPFAKLLDTSDIVFHAEGPAAHNASPTLHAVNWLCQAAEKQLKHLAKSTFDLSDDSASKLAGNLDLRLTGIAHGSFYAGFKIQAPETTYLMEGHDDPVFALIKDTIIRLPEIPSFVGNESINLSIKEALPDIAIRDAMLSAAFNLSPSGRIGIHTLELSAPNQHQPTAKLSQRERVVIREALKRPVLTSPKAGSFVGEIREIDLDAHRFHLRNVKECGTLRCIFAENYDVRELLGHPAKVTGNYEVDRLGRPRLLIVSSIERLSIPIQNELH